MHSPSEPIEYASLSVQRVLGIVPATLVGRYGLSLLHPDDVETALQALAAESGGLASSEAFIQKPFSPDDFVGSVRGMIDLLR